MPKLEHKIRVPGKKADEIYSRVSGEIDGVLKSVSIGHYDLTRDDPSRKVRFESKLVQASLFCTDEALEINASLSLVAVPFKSKIVEILENWARKSFA